MGQKAAETSWEVAGVGEEEGVGQHTMRVLHTDLDIRMAGGGVEGDHGEGGDGEDKGGEGSVGVGYDAVPSSLVHWCWGPLGSGCGLSTPWSHTHSVHRDNNIIIIQVLHGAHIHL